MERRSKIQARKVLNSAEGLPKPIKIETLYQDSDKEESPVSSHINLLPKFEINSCLLCESGPQNTQDLIKHVERVHGVTLGKDLANPSQCNHCPQSCGNEINGMALFLAHVFQCKQTKKKFRRKKKNSPRSNTTSRKRARKLIPFDISTSASDTSLTQSPRSSKRLEDKRRLQSSSKHPSPNVFEVSIRSQEVGSQSKPQDSSPGIEKNSFNFLPPKTPIVAKRIAKSKDITVPKLKTLKEEPGDKFNGLGDSATGIPDVNATPVPLETILQTSLDNTFCLINQNSAHTIKSPLGNLVIKTENKTGGIKTEQLSPPFEVTTGNPSPELFSPFLTETKTPLEPPIVIVKSYSISDIYPSAETVVSFLIPKTIKQELKNPTEESSELNKTHTVIGEGDRSINQKSGVSGVSWCIPFMDTKFATHMDTSTKHILVQSNSQADKTYETAKKCLKEDEKALRKKVGLTRWTKNPNTKTGGWNCTKCGLTFGVQKFYMLHICGRFKPPVEETVTPKRKRPKLAPSTVPSRRNIWK